MALIGGASVRDIYVMDWRELGAVLEKRGFFREKLAGEKPAHLKGMVMATAKRKKAEPMRRGRNVVVSYDVKRLENLSDPDGDLVGELSPNAKHSDELQARWGESRETCFLLEGRNELGRFVPGQKFKVIVPAMPEPVEPELEAESDLEAGTGDEDDIDGIGEDGQALTPEVVELRIENATLKAKLESNSGPHSSQLDTVTTKLLETVVAEHLKPKDPFEIIQQAQEIISMFSPKMPNPSSTPQPPSVSDEEAFFRVLTRNETIVDKLSNGIARKILGGGDGEENWASVAKDIVASGQAPAIIESIFRGLFGGINSTIQNIKQEPNEQAQHQASRPGGPFSDRAQLGQHSQGNPAVPAQSPQTQAGLSDPEMAAPSGEAPQTSGVAQQAGHVFPQPGYREAEQAQPMSYREALLIRVMTECANNTPPEAFADQICREAGRLEEEEPINSINWYLEAFEKMEPQAVLDWLKDNVQGGAQVAALPHALEWTTRLQAELKRLAEEAAQQPQEEW